MSEPTPVFDPPVLENGTSAVEGEGSAPTTDNGAPKENNSQDLTMAGPEEPGVKAAKTGADPAVSDAICYVSSCATTALFTSLGSHSPPQAQFTFTAKVNMTFWILPAWSGRLPAHESLQVAEPSPSSHKPPPSASFPPSRDQTTLRRRATYIVYNGKDGFAQYHLDPQPRQAFSHGLLSKPSQARTRPPESPF